MCFLIFILFGCSEDGKLVEDPPPQEIPLDDPWGECFIAGTPITMEDGESLSIEEIQVGDYVRSMQVDSGLLTAKPVLSVMQGSADTLYTLNTQSSKIEGVTPYHPFYLPNTDEWVRVEDLKTGDALVAVRNERRYIEKIEHIESHRPQQPIKVYNFTVAGPEHNYFAHSLLVHNKSPEDDEPGKPVEIFITSPSDGDVLTEGEHTFDAELHRYNSTVGQDFWTADITWSLTINGETSTVDACSQTLTIDMELAELYTPVSCVAPLTPGEGNIMVEVTDGYNLDDDQISFTVNSSSDTGLD